MKIKAQPLKRQQLLPLMRHTCGVVGVMALISWATMGVELSAQVALSFWRGEVLAQSYGALALQLALSAGMWGAWVMAWRWMKAQRARPQRALRRAAGTVMVETLIIIMPFIMIVNGMAQLTINNIAGLLTDLAAFQAARAVWVWGPEASAGRASANNQLVQEKARLAAAASVAPVVPSSVISGQGDNNEGLDALRGIMFASGNSLSALASSTPGSSARSIAKPLAMGTSMKLSTSGAYDTGLFSIGAARKLTTAYSSVTVTVRTSGEVGASVAYKHYQAFPLVGRLFGSYETVNSRPGYYSTITREYYLTQQTGIKQR